MSPKIKAAQNRKAYKRRYWKTLFQTDTLTYF
jgi:hypothetical protein